MTERSKPSKALTAAQERLLGRYCDNECGVIGRLRAERFCSRNEEARKYVDLLMNLKKEIPSYTAAFPEPSEDLWDRILAKIEYEERLGSIDIHDQDTIWNTLTLGFGRLSYGIVAGCAAAVLIFTVGRSPAVKDPKVSSARIAAVTGQDRASKQKAQPVQLASGRNPYDYLHSRRRVKVHRPSQRSTIFWIRKKDAVVKPDVDEGGIYLDPRLASDPLFHGD